MAEEEKRDIAGGEGKKERSWSHLPSELLCLIFSRVFAGDRVTFRSVCKSWNSVFVFDTQNYQNLDFFDAPWLIFSKNRIFHPIYSEQHQYRDLGHGSDAIIRVAKDGWLLMTDGVCGILFFNPLTKAKVRLPDLPNHVPRSMYFSSPPTSTDWFVIAATSIDGFQIVIYTINCGEEEWSYCEFIKNNSWSFDFSFCNPVVHKGLYYFLGKDAKLLVHDPCRRKFYFHEAPISIRLQVTATQAQQYLLESEGRILAVFVGGDGRWIRTCRWNFSKKTWETLESLGNKMLFVSRPLSICQRASVKGTGNKIYFPRFVDGHCLFYSLFTKKYHIFDSGNSFESFQGSKLLLHSTWFN